MTKGSLSERLTSIRLRSGIAGVVGVALCVLGWAIEGRQFLHSYLFAYLFWFSFALGSLGILMLHHLVSGRWGFVVQRVTEAGARTLPVMAILFIPILIGAADIYPWASHHGADHHDVVGQKLAYLNLPFFIVRTIIYFLLWIGLAFMLSRWSRLQDRNADAGLTRRMKSLSGPGVLLYVLSATFASVDWMMSLEPEWFSTIYGMMFVIGQALATFAFVILMLRLLGREEPLATALTPTHYHHLGNLLMAFVVLWAYMAFSQYLIIWSGDLPEELTWYIKRLGGGWQSIAMALIVFHFFVPFLILLSRQSKRAIKPLSIVAGLVLVMRFVDLYWLVMPSFHPGTVSVHWLDLIAPVAVGGIWIAAFVSGLKGESLLPLHDPRFTIAASEQR